MRYRTIMAAAALLLAVATSAAQDWPERPVHIIMPLTAGSAADGMARTIARRLSEQVGQPFIVENKVARPARSVLANPDYVAAGFRDTLDGEVTLVFRPGREVLIYAYHDYDRADLFSGVRRPARIVAADMGSTMGAEARALVSRLDIVPTMTHFLPMERPQLVREALSDAAQDVEGALGIHRG